MIGRYNRPAMGLRKASVARQRALRIAVLGLVWAIGIFAVVLERSGVGSTAAARPAKSAPVR